LNSVLFMVQLSELIESTITFQSIFSLFVFSSPTTILELFDICLF
jgi:hypothetical protein